MIRRFRLLDFSHPAAAHNVGILFNIIGIFFVSLVYEYLFDISLIRFVVHKNTLIALFLYVLSFNAFAYIVAPAALSRRLPHFKELVDNFSIRRLKTILYILFFFSILFHVFYFIMAGVIPLLHPDAEYIRVSAKRGLGSFVLLASAFSYVYMIFLASYISKQRLRKISLIQMCSVLLICFMIFLVGFRAPAAWGGILFFICYYLLALNKRFFINKRFVLYLFLLLLTVVAMGLIRSGGLGDMESMASILAAFYWSMTVNLFNLNLIVSEISAEQFLYGRSFLTDFSAFVPGVNSEFLGVTLGQMLPINFEGESISVTSIGEAYVNGGFPVIVLYAAVLGFLSELIYRLLLNKNTLMRGLLILVSVCFFRFSTGGIPAIVIFMLLPSLGVFMIFYVLLLLRFK
jgi:oligosaccharide repeat unit polymerase